MSIARMLLTCMCIANTCCIGINNVIAAQDAPLRGNNEIISHKDVFSSPMFTIEYRTIYMIGFLSETLKKMNVPLEQLAKTIENIISDEFKIEFGTKSGTFLVKDLCHFLQK